MKDFYLKNKTILITGASGGIGRETAIRCSEAGARIILSGRNSETLNDVKKELIGTNHEFLICDLTSEKDVKTLSESLPKLDGIVICSGFVNPYPIKFINEKKIKETFSINYFGPLSLLTTISRGQKLNKNCSIVFISSIAAQHPHKGGTLYASSKAALESLSKVMALEFYEMGVRSNCLAPAMVKTALYEYSEENASKETMDAHVAKYPLGVGQPKDVANAALFLLSDASRWITGTTITLDGGFLLGGI